MRATQTRKQIFLGTLLGVVGMLLWGATTWASTRVGDAELQLWYRDRNTFQTDGKDHFDWVQWRSEIFGWMVYDNLVRDGLLLGKVGVPFVKSASFSARYRFRFDPVYLIRDHYRNRYSPDERTDFAIPENGFRDLYADMDFGDVGPGNFSARVGNQQIVWGEADLFRSLDIINPLRLDQNTFAGEKFDEFRTPIFALKGLYTIGTVGTWFSEVAIEPWYSPRMRTGTSDLISEGQYRLPNEEKGCLDNNGNLIPFDIVKCSQGQRIFVPYRPGWIGHRRQQNPWSFLAASGPNHKIAFDDGICLTLTCSPDVFGDRASMIFQLRKKGGDHYFRGWGGITQGGGARLLATTLGGINFTLNYMFIPQDPTGVFDLNRFLVPGQPPGPPQFKPGLTYGDNIPGAAGTFEEGLRRCLSDSGKSNESNSADRGHRAPTILIGADLQGYNDPGRYGPNGALLPNGNPKPGQHQAARPAETFCLPALHDHWWTHVAGITGTYNDFDYTGAVFRMEQSLSTKEVIRQLPGGFGARTADPILASSIQQNFHRYTPVWRSMLGFDLIKSIPSFRYIPGINHSFYDQAWFITGQWLMENDWVNVANNICQNSDNTGNGITQQQADAINATLPPGQKVYSTPRCKRYHWNHLLTLVLANQGLFASRMETRNAVAFEPRAQTWFLYTQNWWRNVLGNPNLELSAGVIWIPSSYHNVSWSSINYYAWRRQLWFEFTYYLL